MISRPNSAPLAMMALLLLPFNAQADPWPHCAAPVLSLQSVEAHEATLVLKSPGLGECLVTVVPEGAEETAPVAVIGNTHHREARLTSLPAGAKIQVKVRCGALPEAMASFVTPPETGQDAPMRILLYGDSRNGPSVHDRLTQMMVAEQADLIIHTGDLVSKDKRDEEWRDFFCVAAPLLSKAAFAAAIGNHESKAIRYRAHMAMPINSPDPERYYSFDWGANHFVVLDSNIPLKGKQKAWLKDDLARSANARLFVVVHHGPFGSGPHWGNREFLKHIYPMIRQKAAAILSGHNHMYERGDSEGVLFVVSGGGGAGLHPSRGKVGQVVSSDHHYVTLDIDGDTISGRAVNSQGREIDRFVVGGIQAERR